MQPHIVIDTGSNTSLEVSTLSNRQSRLAKRHENKSALSLAESFLKGEANVKKIENAVKQAGLKATQPSQAESPLSTPTFGRRAGAALSSTIPSQSGLLQTSSSQLTDSEISLGNSKSPIVHGRRSRQSTTNPSYDNPLIAMLAQNKEGIRRSASSQALQSTLAAGNRSAANQQVKETQQLLTPNTPSFLEKSHSATTLSAVRAGYQAAIGFSQQNSGDLTPRQSTTSRDIPAGLKSSGGSDVIVNKESKREMDALLATALGHSTLAKQASVVLLNSTDTHGMNLHHLLERSLHPQVSQTRLVKSTSSSARVSVQHLASLQDTHPRYRWHLAIKTIMKSVKILQAFSSKSDTQQDQLCPPGLFNQEKLPIINASTFSRQTFQYLLKSFETNADLLVNTKIQILLSVPAPDRNPDDMIRVEKLLSHHMHSLKKFTLDQRLKICQKLRYARYPAGKLIIREGHRAFNFYIVLSGKVDVLKKQPDRLLRLNILNRGDSFGDVGIEGILSKTRTASILTTCETELLVLDKDDYRQVILSKDSEFDIHQRLKMIQEFPLFKHAGLDETVIHQLVMKSETRVFHNNVCILEEGALNPYIFLITQGSVILRKKIDRNVLTGAAIDDSCQRRQNEMIVELGSLDSGHSFPEICMPSLFEPNSMCYRVRKDPISVLHTIEEQNTHIDLELKKILKQIEYEYPNHTAFLSEGVTTCLVLRRMDLLRYLPPQAVRHFYDTLYECCVTDQDIKTDYQRQQEWESYKKHVIDQTCDQLKSVKIVNADKSLRFKALKY